MGTDSTASMTNRSLRYFIVYGFCGGQAHSVKFRKLIQNEGLQPATNAIDADILIAHSAGCLQVPSDTKAKLIILVGVPLDTRTVGTFLRAHLQNILFFYHSHRTIQGLRFGLNNFFYAIVHPQQNYDAAQLVHKHVFSLPTGQTASVVWIANQHDPWPNTQELVTFLSDMPYSFISLAGAHDSIWVNPELFIAIIKHYAGTVLAKTD